MSARRLRIGMLALLSCAAFGAVPTRAAEDADEADAPDVDLMELHADRRVKAFLHPLGARISRYLSAAAEEVDEGKPEEATRLLLKLRPDRLNPFERALVYRMLGFVAYISEDGPTAIDYFEKALAEEVLPVDDEARLRFNIAQLHASLQNWPEVIQWLNRWRRYVDPPDPLGYFLMGIAYYQLEDFDNAIEQARKAVEATSQPQEAWLRLLAALYAQKRDYEKATPVLEELILRFPKKDYWVQLSLIYGARENYHQALAVQQVAYAQGLLTEEKELLRLARSYLYHELPYEAAKALEKALEDGSVEPSPDSLELLANSWIAAREYDRSLPPLQRAAELSDDGNLFVRLGQVRMQREEWGEACELLRRAVDRGGLEDPGNARLLLGICSYNVEQVSGARSHFLQARQHESTRAEADRWLEHIDRELKSQQG